MAQEKNIFINQNETFLETITVTNKDGTPFDLTDFVAYAQMRRNYDSVYYQDLHPIVNIDPTTGLLTLNLTYLETAALTEGRWVYDCYIRNTGTSLTDKLVYGIATVHSTATKA